ncbi:MAG: DUF1853 family protein [Pirellulaceae bacterium]|nr:DUF1853 family protein [Pirellulaceae bacterium]
MWLSGGDRDMTSLQTNRLIRDLLWVVNSPSLVTNADAVQGIESPRIEPAQIEPARIEPAQLNRAQIDPDHLAHCLQKFTGHRVGHYFEHLVHYYLEHVRRLPILARSQQVRDANRTIGEIDLIFRDEQDRVTHWEIAVKFYLHFPHDNFSPSHFIGPNASDTFERKMDRLYSHQLPLSQSQFPDVQIRQAYVKGRIFYALDLPPPERLPKRLSSDHARGHWLRSSQIDSLDASPASRYRILRKPHWLSAEIANEDDPDLLTPSALINTLQRHFGKTDRPVLISQLQPDQQHFAEVSRIFVVSQHWPQKESNRLN